VFEQPDSVARRFFVAPVSVVGISTGDRGRRTGYPWCNEFLVLSVEFQIAGFKLLLSSDSCG